MKYTYYEPQALTSLRQWVFWKKEILNDHTTKIPYSINYNGKASSTDPDTWGSFQNWYPPEYDGLGFVITKESGLVFIDLDDCVDAEGNFSNTAKEILQILKPTYIEYSQSGHGLHFFVRGYIPRSFKNTDYDVEAYCEKRYCAMTFKALYAAEPSDDQEGLDYIFNKYKTPERRSCESRSMPQDPLSLSESRIVELASKREKFRSLFHDGDFQQYASRGESGHHIADLVLCMMLAFWCDRDRDLIDNIFRKSALYREKWLRDDYREDTLELACANCEESISEFIERRRRETADEYKKHILQIW